VRSSLYPEGMMACNQAVSNLSHFVMRREILKRYDMFRKSTTNMKFNILLTSYEHARKCELFPCHFLMRLSCYMQSFAALCTLHAGMQIICVQYRGA
jgi:hypothetical protein